MISLDSQIDIPETLLCREIEGEAVLLELEKGRYYGLDPVGTRMFSLITRHRRLRPVHADLLAEYDVEAEALERDLLAFTAELVAQQLIGARESDTP